MKILAVCSTINFRDFTRRASIEAIRNEAENLDILLFLGLKSIFKKKVKVPDINFISYHFWVPEKLKKFGILKDVEHKLRKKYWAKMISKYDWIFFTDPNQAWLLDYVVRSKLVYLIRDPNILQNIKCKGNETEILRRSDLVLATSKNLETKYLLKYYGFNHKNIYYWPNSVNIKAWYYPHLKSLKTTKINKIAGVAGNLNDRTDLELLEYISAIKPEIHFILVGNNNLSNNIEKFETILKRSNVIFLGFIPFDILPREVIKWDIGLTIERVCEYTEYTHHNKVYQYLALGLPVVTLQIHNDYEDFHPYIQSAVDYKNYSDAIDYALEQSKVNSFKEECIRIAMRNSSEVRAKEFMSLLEIS